MLTWLLKHHFALLPEREKAERQSRVKPWKPVRQSFAVTGAWSMLIQPHQ